MDAHPCSCETCSHGNLGPVDGGERLARILSPLHFNKMGRLKPSAFAVSHLKEVGLSLVRVDRIDANEMIAIAQDVLKSSGQDALKGALVGAAQDIRDTLLPDGARALCVKDDPVLDVEGIRDNPAHAISVATRKLADEDVMEIRSQIWEKFTPVEQIADLYR